MKMIEEIKRRTRQCRTGLGKRLRQCREAARGRRPCADRRQSSPRGIPCRKRDCAGRWRRKKRAGSAYRREAAREACVCEKLRVEGRKKSGACEREKDICAGSTDAERPRRKHARAKNRMRKAGRKSGACERKEHMGAGSIDTEISCRKHAHAKSCMRKAVRKAAHANAKRTCGYAEPGLPPGRIEREVFKNEAGRNQSMF